MPWRGRAAYTRRMNERYDHDLFLVKQKHLALGKSKFYVYDESGAALFYVERPVQLLPRRANISVYADDSKAELLLVLHQDHYFELRRREYTVIDQVSGETVGHLSRDNIRAWLRRSWDIRDAAGNVIAICREDTKIMSAVRRIIDWIPYVSLLGMAIKTDFHILAADAGETRIGTFVRKLGLSDKYVLDLKQDPARTLDRRLAVALGILLDTAEAR